MVRIRVGAQVSAAGGVSRAIQRAVAIEAEAVQIFVDPNRRYPRGPLPLDELDRLRRGLRWARLTGYVHVPYLANVATTDAGLLARSVEMVARALTAADTVAFEGSSWDPRGARRGPQRSAPEGRPPPAADRGHGLAVDRATIVPPVDLGRR